MKQGQKAKKTPRLQTKIGKYFMLTSKGIAKNEAQRRAGFAMDNKSSQIEATSEFKALQVYFKDSFLQKMSMDEISDALIDNIKQPGQERKDRNAINGAVKIVLDKLEPQGGQKSDTSDKVLIVLSK